MVSRVHGYTPQGRAYHSSSIGRDRVITGANSPGNSDTRKPFEKRTIPGGKLITKPCVIGQGQIRIRNWTCRCVDCLLSGQEK